jgi:DNA-binding transcriptional regulator YbjK
MLLMDAAVKVVANAGAGALTHRAVAAEAQVSIASVTYHFGSIGELRRETFAYAGSSIGLELADLVLAAGARIDDVPEICASYAERLVVERRVQTAAVFELIIAAGHDDELKPVVALYNGMLADLLAPYAGGQTRARTVGAAVQGLLLAQLASAFPVVPAELADAVSDLIRRYRAHAPAQAGREAFGNDTTMKR